MEDINLSQVENDVSVLSRLLIDWYNNRQLESLGVQDLHSSAYAIGSSLITDLVSSTKPTHRLELTVGEHEIEGYKFRKGVNGLYSYTREQLDAGNKLQLRSTNEIAINNPGLEEPKGELYIGKVIMVGLSVIARTLTESGSLAIIELSDNDL